MNHAISICIDYLFGFFLQSLGCALNIYAFNKRKVKAKEFLFMSFLISVATYIIRNIKIINFGFHTILVIIASILISVLIFKFPIYTSALSMLIYIIMIMVCEVLNYALMYFTIGSDVFSAIMSQTGSYNNPIYKSIIGIPINIILVIMTFVIYKLSVRHLDGKKKETTV